MSVPLVEALVNSSPDVIVVVDERGIIVFVNDRCQPLLGFAPEELLGENVEVLVPAEHAGHSQIRSLYQASPTSKQMGHRPVLSARHKSGVPIPVEISLSPLPQVPGHGQLIQAVIRDGMPHWLSQQERRLQAVAMDSVASGIVITDTHGVIEWVNPAVTRITGYPSAELLGQHTRLLKSGLHDDLFYRELWQTVSAGNTWFGEIANRHKNGTVYYEEQHIAPVKDERGEITHFIAVKQDVTTRRLAETSLKAANDELRTRLEQVEMLQRQLRDQAIRDPLTNLFNRRYLNETLKRELLRAQRENLELCLITVDLDHFKELNDRDGHAAGDAVLQSVARLLLRFARESDMACRLGGDEFLLVLAGSTLDVATRRAELLRKAFLEADLGGLPPGGSVSLSIGVTQLRPGDTNGKLLRRGDKALYEAKRSGRNRVAVA